MLILCLTATTYTLNKNGFQDYQSRNPLPYDWGGGSDKQ